jgi:hypothetical protein
MGSSSRFTIAPLVEPMRACQATTQICGFEHVRTTTKSHVDRGARDPPVGLRPLYGPAPAPDSRSVLILIAAQHGTSPWNDAAHLETAAISFTIATRSARLPSWQSLSLPTQRPCNCLREAQMNPHSERWVTSVREECVSKLILFGERSLRPAMKAYVAHYYAERNHQGKSNVTLFPHVMETRCDGAMHCRERLGGLLRWYHRDAA